jgi:hypothetical protein
MEYQMTDTYRALCAELVADYDDCHYRSELSDRAHAALAEPEPVPVGPTDEDLVELACAEVYNSRNWEEPECTTDDPYPYEASSFAWLNFARAVLARWGRP